MENIGAFLWEIKKIVNKGDYNYAVVPEHPNRTKNNYVLEHRIIIENHLGRILNKNEVVHHINGDKKDNRIKNLQVMDSKEHNKLHADQQGQTMLELICPSCKKVFSIQKKQTHVGKKRGKTTSCSNSCRGKFSRQIQLYGITKEVENAIS